MTVFIYHMLNIRYQMSDVKYHMPHIICQISDFAINAKERVRSAHLQVNKRI